MSDLAHVFPRLQASWLLSLPCLLGDAVLELVHKFDDFAQYWIQQLLGAPAFASLVILTGFGGIENMFRVSLLRPVSLCTLLHTMPYLSTLATIRRSTSLKKNHFAMSMFGVAD